MKPASLLMAEVVRMMEKTNNSICCVIFSLSPTFSLTVLATSSSINQKKNPSIDKTVEGTHVLRLWVSLFTRHFQIESEPHGEENSNVLCMQSTKNQKRQGEAIPPGLSPDKHVIPQK